MTTYNDVIRHLNHSKGRVSVAATYENGDYGWLPIDKAEYLRQLKMIGNPEINFPCMIKFDGNETYIHPTGKNHGDGNLVSGS